MHLSELGRVWVNVADYVDKGQMTTARLDKDKGYIFDGVVIMLDS